MGLNIKNGKKWSIYSLGIGSAYLIFGILALASGFSLAYGFDWAEWGVSTAIVHPDIFSGIMLIIIGATFLFGTRSQWKGNREGVSFLAVGALLAAIFFAVYIAIMASHAVGCGIYNVVPESYAEIVADWAEWTWIDDLRPEIWLFTFVLPSLYLTVKLWRAKK